MNEELEQQLVHLQHLVNDGLGNIFMGKGRVGESSDVICTEVFEIVEKFVDMKNVFIDLAKDIYMNFLKFTLPVLVETFLRRDTLR